MADDASAAGPEGEPHRDFALPRDGAREMAPTDFDADSITIVDRARYRLEGENLKLYALLSPHLNSDRKDNTAWAGIDLAARLGGVAVSLRNDAGFSKASAGYVGTSDGWQDFSKHGAMTWSYPEASEGNVA